MANVTRHALRVYTALLQLRGNNADVLDSLLPFFDPILEQLDNSIFDPGVFAKGVHHLYRWRFNRDIAEQFIPRLERKGLLVKQGDGRDAVYIVKYQQAERPEQADILSAFDHIIDEFEKFPPRITDLLTYARTREQLKDILIRFLVSMDAYGEGAFSGKNPVEGGPGTELFSQLEEGGTPLRREDRYMAARFVKDLSVKEPACVPQLARLASIGLLTEVVEDFLKPIQRETRTNLTIVVDAPLALDYLGCSGKALHDDVKGIFDALRKIGCSIVVFPGSCLEMRRNLSSMLALPPPKRHGYTHDALARGEVMLDFVEAVANDPEGVLANAGIQTKPLSLDQYPRSHVFFDQNRYEDFFASVSWVQEIEPREHDASSMTLVMRLREGKHNSDIFKCGYVFVTRNARFVSASRKYCVDSRLITPIQQGPVIHQRELATTAWLRTGLGADDEQIPRSHLLATCDRVLHIRSEVPKAVAAALKSVTPEKLEQFELLLLDHRSIRKLADETLNDERVVTAENAERLLELMRRATAEEERNRYLEELSVREARHREIQRKSQAAMADTRGALNQATAEALGLKEQQRAIVEGLVSTTNSQLETLGRCAKWILGILVALAIVNFLTGVLATSVFWKLVLNASAVLGLYFFVTNVLGIEKIGLTQMQNRAGAILISRRLEQLNLPQRVEEFRFEHGRVSWRASND